MSARPVLPVAQTVGGSWAGGAPGAEDAESRDPSRFRALARYAAAGCGGCGGALGALSPKLPRSIRARPASFARGVSKKTLSNWVPSGCQKRREREQSRGTKKTNGHSLLN